VSGNHYTILGISEGATQREIKVAYRKLVQEHHPDVNNSGSDEMIKSINVAYEILSDSTKRVTYDRRRQDPFQYQPRPSYNSPTASRQKRSPPPHSYYKYQDDTTYFYTTKTKLQGFAAVVFTILIIYFGFMGMHYYASIYYFEEGQKAEANEDYTQAFSSYRWAIRNWGSKNIEATLRMIALNRQSENYFSMLDKVITGFSYNPDSTEAGALYYLQGIGYEHTNKFPEAAISFNKSLQLKYNKDSIYAHLGPLYLSQLQQYNEASNVYSYLLLDNTNNLQDHYFRAISYQHLGKHRLALEDLLLILKEDPYNGKFLFQVGRSYLALGQNDKGCEYLHRAIQQGIKIDPEEFANVCD